jgi:5-methylcytosine-specific restriction protein B
MAIINDADISETAATPEERKALVLAHKARIKSGQVVFTTFHQSYGYEDFIQGLRPVTNADVMKFSNVDGVFKRVADKAMLTMRITMSSSMK